MTQRHRTFSSRPKVLTPVTFELNDESFTAVPSVPGAKLLDFIADADSNDGGRAAQALVDFLEGAIIEDDRERFRNLIRDPEQSVEIEVIAEICEWLVGEYSQRPTTPPTQPSAGPSPSGTGSTETVSSAV
jgi:hypothetical protein